MCYCNKYIWVHYPNVVQSHTLFWLGLVCRTWLSGAPFSVVNYWEETTFKPEHKLLFCILGATPWQPTALAFFVFPLFFSFFCAFACRLKTSQLPDVMFQILVECGRTTKRKKGMTMRMRRMKGLQGSCFLISSRPTNTVPASPHCITFSCCSSSVPQA